MSAKFISSSGHHQKYFHSWLRATPWVKIFPMVSTRWNKFWSFTEKKQVFSIYSKWFMNMVCVCVWTSLTYLHRCVTAGIPAEPDPPVVQEFKDGEFEVTWKAPDGRGEPITHYMLQYRWALFFLILEQFLWLIPFMSYEKVVFVFPTWGGQDIVTKTVWCMCMH